MWGISLSAPLDIVGLVGRYPANYLMSRMPVRNHNKAFVTSPCEKVTIWGISLSAPLGIVGLVGRCPANYLMPRMPIRDHN